MLGSSNLYLVGPMGSGKTAVGKQLGRLLDHPFVDSDHEIEVSTGADIPLIFEREGEAGFRQRERDMIAVLVRRQPVVLATGGGAVLDPASRQLLHEHGYVCYLETSPEQQAERAARTRHRPLLHGVDARQRLTELLAIRDPLYRSIADFVVPTDSRKVHAVAEEILTRFRQQQPTQ